MRNGTVPAKHSTSRQSTGKQQMEKNKMRKDIEISNAANGKESHLLLAVALSISMIFTSYAVSVLNHHDEDGMHAQTLTHRPFVVSYLA
jgi:hypothetical protein